MRTPDGGDAAVTGVACRTPLGDDPAAVLFAVRAGAEGARDMDGADVPDPGRSPEEEVTAGDRDARMRAALRRLPARDRQLLALLMASRRPSYGKVSAELRMPVGSIGPTRARCLARLRRELEADGVDEQLLSA